MTQRLQRPQRLTMRTQGGRVDVAMAAPPTLSLSSRVPAPCTRGLFPEAAPGGPRGRTEAVLGTLALPSHPSPTQPFETHPDREAAMTLQIKLYRNQQNREAASTGSGPNCQVQSSALLLTSSEIRQVPYTLCFFCLSFIIHKMGTVAISKDAKI